ncbi:heme-binding domain-containing protein [Aquimarina sp. 2201CG5-10]|uniref:heme-binding domain-containing protein n=1 Tax=Aquimarina callyspongiae TaxID=3098150 RepID=UPI002AB4E1C1|nr:heme-binding domain-containing protein [Aquimarina sp. 2201CG5-10]MDY8137807.1 heme-binding domain-containing protein [Aquimarina sp. 2201CG5-10]
MKKILKKVGIALLIILLVMQFIRPDKNESGYESVAYFETATKPTEAIQTILKDKCYDCHSNQTIYPWYAEIAPVSYWLSDHVEEGKEHFNVSEWEQYSDKKRDHKLEELIEEVEEGEMPLSSYTWLHGNLEEGEKEILIDWVKKLRSQYASVK